MQFQGLLSCSQFIGLLAMSLIVALADLCLSSRSVVEGRRLSHMVFTIENTSEEILLVGNIFGKVRPLFTLGPTSCETSMMTGINLCDQLSDCMYIFSLSALLEKCFVFPLNLQKDIDERNVCKWDVTRFNH